MCVLIEVQAASRPVKRGDVQGSVPPSPASSKSRQRRSTAQLMNFDVVRFGNSEDCLPHCSCGRVAASVLQNPVIDDLGLCAVLEGCRELRKLSLAHVHAGDRVMHMLATKSKQLEVRASSLKVLRGLAAVSSLTGLTGFELPPACPTACIRVFCLPLASLQCLAV